jgi:hypothetical protein
MSLYAPKPENPQHGDLYVRRCPACNGPKVWVRHVREMTLADIVAPWVWGYNGHVLPNGEVVNERDPMPVWHSNCPTWHGV